MKKLVNEWRYIALFGSLVLLLGLLLRVINLTILPVFADEAIYIRWAQVMRAESTLRFLPLSDGKQPLFMWVVIPFLKLFSDPLVAGRLVSVFTGLGTLTGVGVLSYLLFRSKKAALITSLFYAVSPFALFFDRMALVDSMLAMFGVWTAILVYLTIKHVRLDMAMLAGFSLGGAALTKSPALFFALLLPTATIFTRVPKKAADRVLQIMKVAGLLLITLLIATGLYNILRLGPNFHMLSSRNFDYVHPYTHIFENPLDPFIPHFNRSLEWIRIFGPEILIFFILFGLIKSFRKYKLIIIFLMLWSFGPVLVQSMYAKVFTARYIFFTLPFFYVLAGSSFTEPLTEKGKKILYVVFTAFVLMALRADYLLLTDPERARLPRSERSGYLEEWTAGTGIKESADIIRAEHEKEPAVPIVVGTEGYFGTLPDALQAYLERVPNVTVIGVGLGINQIPDQLQEAVRSGSKAYLIANTSRLNFDGEFEDHGLEVVQRFKKADRPEGIREYNEHGQFDYLYLFRVTETGTISRQ